MSHQQYLDEPRDAIHWMLAIDNEVRLAREAHDSNAKRQAERAAEAARAGMPPTIS